MCDFLYLIGLIQGDSKVPLPRQFQQGERTDVHQTEPSGVLSAFNH